MRKIESELRQSWGQKPIAPNWRPEVLVGGSKSEGQWRSELSAHGWPVLPPENPEVEVQIDRTYSAFKLEQLFISQACPRLINEVVNYSRPVDENGTPMEGIEDKEIWHGCDSLRYVIAYLDRKGLDFYFGIV
jgi:hypothetical protein